MPVDVLFLYAGIGTALLLALALFTLIYRRKVRRKLHVPVPSGRLGAVTSFALDHRRDLVVVRRDDVEDLYFDRGAERPDHRIGLYEQRSVGTR